MAAHVLATTGIFLMPAVNPGTLGALGAARADAPLLLLPLTEAEPPPQPAAAVVPPPPSPPLPPTPPLPPEPPEVRLGADDAAARRETWLSSPATGEHVARPSTIDQPALTKNPRPEPPPAPPAAPPAAATRVPSAVPPTPASAEAGAQAPPARGTPDGETALPPRDARELATPTPAAPPPGAGLPPTPVASASPTADVSTKPAPEATPATDDSNRPGPREGEAAALKSKGDESAKPDPARDPVPLPSSRGSDLQAVPPDLASQPATDSPAAAPPAPPTPSGRGSAPILDTDAWLADREADGSSIKRAAIFRSGRVEAGQGLDIRTVRPIFTAVTRALAFPTPPIVEVKFDRAGRVSRVRVIRSSGYADVDGPIVNAVYQWQARGDELGRIGPEPDAGLVMRITFLLN